MMTLAQLRHLVTLAETRSFSRAAELLHLTQPALSRSIRALEDTLGQPVFDRIGRRIEPTAFGEEVLRRARQLVSDAQALAECGVALGEGRTGSLRLGLGSGPGAMLMTPLLLHMARHHPRLQFEIARGPTEMLTLMLRERRLDALVADIRSVPPSLDLSVAPLSEMRGTFMCRRGHPLVRRRRPVPFSALLDYPIAAIPLSDEVARMLVERYGPAAHPDACVTLRCNELASLVDVARGSDAVLLSIRGAAPDLVEIAMDPPLASTARFGLVTLAGRSVSPALALVHGRIVELLRD